MKVSVGPSVGSSFISPRAVLTSKGFRRVSQKRCREKGSSQERTDQLSSSLSLSSNRTLTGRVALPASQLRERPPPSAVDRTNVTIYQAHVLIRQLPVTANVGLPGPLGQALTWLRGQALTEGLWMRILVVTWFCLPADGGGRSRNCEAGRATLPAQRPIGRKGQA